MKNSAILLRISYWLGAILDGFLVVPMLVPEIGGAIFGIDDFDPSQEYRYAMIIGASLMLGWTVLLLWADRKPFERKDVLLITVLPVIIGMVLAGVFAANVGVVEVQRMVPMWILQAGLVMLFSYSYYTARRAEQSSVRNGRGNISLTSDSGDP